MGQLLSYSIVSGLLMLSMFLAYRTFMAGDNQPRYNRAVIMAIYAIAFALFPLISLLRRLFVSPSAVSVVENAVAMPENYGASSSAWASVLLWVFMAGMAVVAVRTIATWWRLTRLIRDGEKIGYGGYTIVLTDDARFAPFSWMRYIVVNRQDYATDRTAIAIHEIGHISRRHWIDLLVAQIVCIVNWFNPAAWLMREDLMLVHEYQADMAVIDSGLDIKDYQMLLIRKAVGARFPSLANSLNHSKLKKRITMMQKEKSGARRKLKALALVPMLAMAVGVAAVPSVRAAISTIGSSGFSVDKDSENPALNETAGQIYKGTVIKKIGKETTVIINGENFGDHLTVSGGTLAVDGRTYYATSLQCSMTDGNAEMTATFPFAGEVTGAVMTLNMNGRDVPFSIGSYVDDKVQSDRFALLDGMTIYLDGKKISREELLDVPAEKISSMKIDAQKKKVYVELK